MWKSLTHVHKTLNGNEIKHNFSFLCLCHSDDVFFNPKHIEFFKRQHSVEDTWHNHCAFSFATVRGVSTYFHIDYPFCRQTFCTVHMTSVRLLPSEIVRESLLCCTWQLMESRNLRSVIKNFPFKFSSWERWQLPVSWLVLIKISQELQDVYELNVINKQYVWNMITEQMIQIILPLSVVNIFKHFVMQTVL
jgi:hypothetical protein